MKTLSRQWQRQLDLRRNCPSKWGSWPDSPRALWWKCRGQILYSTRGYRGVHLTSKALEPKGCSHWRRSWSPRYGDRWSGSCWDYVNICVCVCVCVLKEGEVKFKRISLTRRHPDWQGCKVRNNQVRHLPWGLFRSTAVWANQVMLSRVL